LESVSCIAEETELLGNVLSRLIRHSFQSNPPSFSKEIKAIRRSIWRISTLLAIYPTN